MADTLRNLITDALVDLNAIQQGDGLSDEDADIGFRRVNLIVDRGNADRLLLHSIADNSDAPWQLTPNKGAYTIGKKTPLADIDIARPVLIQTASIVIAEISHPLEPKTSVQWAAIPERKNTAILPTAFYFDYRWPVGTLRLNPIPNSAAFLEAFYWEPLPQFATIDDLVDLPPAYRSYLQHNLSIVLAAPYMKTITQTLLTLAVNAKADVRAFNAMQLAGMLSDATVGQIPMVPAPQVDPTRQAPQAQPQPQQ